MGKLWKAKFVAAHQQAGDFEAVFLDGKAVEKNGGNVASYFCTPEGRVVNAVLGPVGADALLREAQWAVDVYESIESLPPSDRDARLAKAHAAAASQSRDAQERQIHQFLAKRPLAGLDQIYSSVFELLGEGPGVKLLNSPVVKKLEEDNNRLEVTKIEIKKQIKRLLLPDGRGSVKVQIETAKNSVLTNDVEQLRQQLQQQLRKLAQNEADASKWLIAAIAYMREDKEAGKVRLKDIEKRYPNTKAAQKAAKLLARTAD